MHSFDTTCKYTIDGIIQCIRPIKQYTHQTPDVLEGFTSATALNVTSDIGVMGAGNAFIMSPGDITRSANGQYYLEYTSDGNLYVKNSNNKLWAADLSQKPVFPMYAIVQDDGNFVLYHSMNSERTDPKPYWASNTSYAYWQNRTPVRLVMGNDGSLCLFDKSNAELWRASASGAAASGGSETSYDAYRVHIFNTSGTFAVHKNFVTADILIVGGGGGGGGGAGCGGGGGGGQIWYNTSIALSKGTYTITVGNGGPQNANGQDSIVLGNGLNLYAKGGGAGGTARRNGEAGGSGGGGGNTGGGSTAGGTGLTGIGGNNGSIGLNSTVNGTIFHNAGGGGGATSPGEYIVNSSLNRGANGGVATSYNMTGTSRPYGGGGGGGSTAASWRGISSASMGNGGGGNGGYNVYGTVYEPTSGMANTGGGGGGSRWDGPGGSGGSGIVVIRYLTW